MRVNLNELQGIPETLVFTLYLRYRESLRPDGRFKDARYAELVERLDYDFSVFDGIPDDFQISVVCRSIIFDNITRSFISAHPETNIISLGSGLEFRYDRTDNGQIQWFDIDLPEVINLRRVFSQEKEHLHFISSSAFDFAWMDRIPKDSPIFFIAEGLLVYFPPDMVKALMVRLTDTFPGSELAFDVYSNFYLRYGKSSATHPFLRRMIDSWQWGVDDWSEIEAWHPGIRLMAEYYQHEAFGERIPPGFKNALTDEMLPEGLLGELLKLSRIGHFKLG